MATPNSVRPEYPRPDLERQEWINLNGEWQFEFDDNNIGEEQGWYKTHEFSQKIIVPFCYQSKLSGINDEELHEYIWYKKEFELPEEFLDKRVLLNFGAVDYLAKVWINNEFVYQHKGGHISFKMEITRYLKDGNNTIVVKAEDKYDTSQPRGKQYWKAKPDRCWYTATSGIWQTVWLETVGESYIDRLRLTPDIDRKNVLIELILDNFVSNLSLSIEVYFNGEVVRKMSVELDNRVSRFTIDFREQDYIDEIHYWTPENPNLYDVQLILIKNSNEVDSIKTYFGMRKISIKDDMILLNNKPYYQKLILDQGYWPESLLTPPSDAAIKYDIEMTKIFGFNGARKHQKFEDPRYYYWADKLGLLVWGEMPSAYNFNSEEIENLTHEWIEFINRDYNHPCIIAWVPLNESWGIRNIIADKNQQNLAKSLYYTTKALDGTRLVSTNDGWEMVQDTDIIGIHDYAAFGENFTPRYVDRDKLLNSDAQGRMLFCEEHSYGGQPILLTEYGGIAFESSSKENWGYFGAVKTADEFFNRYESITKAVRNVNYIRGYCYTQLTDVMQEVNGLLTADRRVKVNVEKIRKINS
jgi:beta-galactosidase/beta-glucuronidase